MCDGMWLGAELLMRSSVLLCCVLLLRCVLVSVVGVRCLVLCVPLCRASLLASSHSFLSRLLPLARTQPLSSSAAAASER